MEIDREALARCRTLVAEWMTLLDLMQTVDGLGLREADVTARIERLDEEMAAKERAAAAAETSRLRKHEQLMARLTAEHETALATQERAVTGAQQRLTEYERQNAALLERRNALMAEMEVLKVTHRETLDRLAAEQREATAELAAVREQLQAIRERIRG